MIEIMKPNFEYEDERGKLVQLVREGFSQINIVYSKEGVVRGDHWHDINEEAFYVIEGKLKLYISDGEANGEYEFSKGEMFKIRKCVKHSFTFLQDTLLVSMYDIGVELGDGKKDIIND